MIPGGRVFVWPLIQRVQRYVIHERAHSHNMNAPTYTLYIVKSISHWLSRIRLRQKATHQDYLILKWFLELETKFS